jgi:mevalonate kinase
MGEHSAVYGHPALVAALGRRVRAEVVVGGSGVEFDLKTLGHREECTWQQIVDYSEEKSRAWRRFDAAAGSVSFDEVRGYDPAHVVKVALGEVVRECSEETLPGMRLVVDSEIPVGSGFGSSAAVAVAVVGASLRLLGRTTGPDQIARLVLMVERRQHGHPSGVDHAAVLHGGILRVSRREPAIHLDVAQWVQRDLALFHTGTPAEETGEVVEAVRRLKEQDQPLVSRALDTMAMRVNDFESHLQTLQPDVGAVLQVISDFERCLEELGVVPEAVRTSVRGLEENGAAAKISGAGALTGPAAGCLLVYRPPEATLGVDDALARYHPIEAEIGVEGLRIEEIA